MTTVFTPPVPSDELLDLHDAFARVDDADAPGTPLDPMLGDRVREIDAQATNFGRFLIRQLRETVPRRLRDVAAPFERDIAPREGELAQIRASGDQSVGAQGACLLLERQIAGVRGNLQSAVAREASSQGEALDRLEQELRKIVATDDDPEEDGGSERAMLDRALRDMEHVDENEALGMAESLVHKWSREPITASGRAALRALARVLRSWGRTPGYARETPRGTRLATLAYVVGRLGVDPRVAGALRALQYVERGRVELAQLARAVVDLHAVTEVDRTLAASTLNARGPGGFAVLKLG